MRTFDSVPNTSSTYLLGISVREQQDLEREHRDGNNNESNLIFNFIFELYM